MDADAIISVYESEGDSLARLGSPPLNLSDDVNSVRELDCALIHCGYILIVFSTLEEQHRGELDGDFFEALCGGLSDRIFDFPQVPQGPLVRAHDGCVLVPLLR